MKLTLKDFTCFVPELSNSNYNEVEEILGAISGVTCPGINTSTKEVRITFDPQFVTQETIINTLKKGGFNPTITEKD